MEPIRLYSLGRAVQVGDFYNYFNDSILPGSIRVLRQNVDINLTCDVERSFLFQQPDKFLDKLKRHMLGINSHLDQSIEGGSLGFEKLWFADYLKPTQVEANMAQVDVIFRIIRRTEGLNQQYFDRQILRDYQLATGGKATHVVERVFYGAELIVSMRRPLDLQCESKASAEGNIYLAAKAYFENIVPNRFLEKQPVELASIRCTIFSSINAGNVRKTTFEDSCKLLRDVINSTNEEKWQPIEIILQCIPAQIEARFLSDKMKDVDFDMERQLAMLKTIVKESNVISKYPSIDRVPPLEKAMCQFIDLLTPLRIEIENFHSQRFAKIPQQMLVEMEPIASLLTEMTDWLIHRRKEVEIMCSILSGNTLPMSQLEEIESSVFSGKQERTRVLILKMDYVQDPLIDRLAKLLGNCESFKIPVFWIATEGKHRIEHIVKKLKYFEELNTTCTSLGNSYQIGLVPFSSSMIDGKVITVAHSVGDHPKVAATELPDRPIQPSINSQEDKLPIPSSNSTLFPPVKTSLIVPTVYNHQQLRARSVKQPGPIKSAHPSIEEDCPALKDVDRKEPVMAIPSTPRDDQQTQNKYSELGGHTKSERVTCTPSIPLPANVRKKSFELTKEHDSMKQAQKQEPAADVQIEQNVKAKSLITEKGQPTKKPNLPVAARLEKATPSMKSATPAQENLASRHQASVIPKQTEKDVLEQSEAKEKSQTTKKLHQFSPVTTHFGNSTETLRATGFDTLSEAISTFEPAPSVQESPPIHQHIQQASAIHQQDLDRQQIEVQNQEQNFPKEADSTTSAKIGRVAEMFAQETNQYAKLIKQGQPNVYLLNAKEISVSEDFRWFDIDHHDASATPEVHREHKIIILMGATGCGKSTLINGMVNYILGVKWNDPFRFKCVREDETTARNQAISQTSSVSAYTLRHHDGMAVPYSITIIDTPGYGDTRGMVRDRLITRNIHQFLTQQENRVDQIHAACFVAASGDSRLTATQRYIIDSVLSIFGKDVKENMRLLVTFADNADPPVVEACLAANFPVTSASAGITFSKFNSSVLYASNQNQGDFCFDELFWDMGQENFYKFFTMLEEMNGRNLKSTREVIQRRQQLEQSLKDIETELEGALSTIEGMEEIHRKLRECDNKIEANKNFVLEKTEVRNVEVKCDKGFSAYNCKQCKKTCEKPAKIINFERKMCTDRNCYCPPSAHVYQNFSLLKTTAKVTTTLLDMKAEYESNHNRKLKTEDIMASCLDDLNMAKGKVLSLLEQVGANAKSLDSTALRSNALSPAEYLSLMRSRVLEEQKPGYLTRLQTLTELQQSLAFPAVPAAKKDKCPVTPTAQPGKVNAGSCGRGRLLAMSSTGSPGESTNSGRGETSSRSESQNYSGLSKIPPAGGSGTDSRYQSKMSGTNSHVSASTTSASSQKRTEETKEGGGAGRGHGSGRDITSKWQENPVQQEKVNVGSCGRGRGYLLSMDPTDSSGESDHSGRGETSSRSAQNYSGSSNIPSTGTSASGSGSATGLHCQSGMSGTNNKVAASTTPASSQRNKTEETKADGGVGRASFYSNSGRQVRHPSGEPENYYKSSEKAPMPCQKKDAEDGKKPDVTSKGNENGFSSEEETEQSNKQTKKKKNYVVSFFESWIPWK
ncbi:uncharacterized protein LOC124209330 [Daphnia pulex]|uniref:uncharacterized protein LOC124209330 n=1 Tax=Daphnia pulex TaxID=6669 RepID=UPI001EDED4C5|nr:uncharacterized protein LOC124209330 [Daphnia pulex]